MTPTGPPPVPGGRQPGDREAARREREARRAAREQADGDGDGRRAGPPRDGAQDGRAASLPRRDASDDGGADRAARRAARRAEKDERKAAREAFRAREKAREADEKARAGIAKPAKPGKPAKAPKAAKPPRQPRRPKSRDGDRSWRDRAQRLTAESRKPAAAPKRRPSASGLKHPRLLAGLAIAGGLVVLVALWFLFSLFQPFAGDGRGEGRVRVQVPAGAGVGSIADLLERRGVVGSAFFFQTRARLSGRAGDLKPGAYMLGKGMSVGTALDVLAEGPTPNVLNVTVPEGRSRREVARTLPRQLKGSYMAATESSKRLKPSRYGAPPGSSLEGFLFPSTYEVKKGRPVRVLVDDQLAAFKREFATVKFSPTACTRTRYDVLTVASMIEREAQVARERPLIAAVICNRLRDGIPLGIDATVRYAVNNWNRPLTQSQLQVQSPYNTRSTKGLPPGPIGSPGIESIRAAAKPARTGYLFYVVKPGTCGEHAFSETNARFEADVARYNRERQRKGGRSPTKC